MVSTANKTASQKKNRPFKVVSRKQWGAMEGTTPRKQRVVHPVGFVNFTDTDTEAIQYQDISEYLREVQKFRMWGLEEHDTPYNFVIGPDLKIYEVLGWKVDADWPKRMNYLTSNCIRIAFVGCHEEGFTPSYSQWFLAYDLIQHGIKNNYISPTFKQIPLGWWRPSFWRPDTAIPAYIPFTA